MSKSSADILTKPQLKFFIKEAIKLVLNEMKDFDKEESFYIDASDKEAEYAQVQSDLKVIKNAGLTKEYEALMKNIFNLPVDEFDKRTVALEKLMKRAHQIVGTPLKEITTTGNVTGYNIPGWISQKGGSKRGVRGSEKLGYTLTSIGKQEMNRRAADPK